MADFEKQKGKWDKQRAKGKTEFVLFYVTVWAIYSAVFATLQILFFHRTALSDIKELIITYVIFLIFFVPAGIAVGNMAWSAHMKKFSDTKF
jgi:hypothetical protein